MQANTLLDAIDALSSVILAIFTIVLAVVTWQYYHQSKLQTAEMERERKLAHEPHLKAGVKANGPNFEIGFVNIGGGIAHNVEAEYWVEGLDQFQREWGTAIHFPEDIYRIGFPIEDSPIGYVGGSDQIESKLNDGEDTFVVKWSYEDARGQVFEETQRFQILEEIAKGTESTTFYSGQERDVRF